MPLHVGLLPGTPALTDIRRPQLSYTTGGVGIVAKATHDTVEFPGYGIVTTGGAILYVNFHTEDTPGHAV